MSKQIAFGDIVVVEKKLIGVVVKLWNTSITGSEEKLEVYVRNYRTIVDYDVSEVDRYLVRHKELDDDELEWQFNGVNL